MEFDDVRVKITYPEVKPFEPDIPPAYGMPNPVAPGYIETYFQEKILVGIKDANEDYVYGERLSGVLINRHDGIMDDPVIVGPDQIGAVVEKYKKYGFNTNQTTMEVGRPEDCLLNDPPCLRLIDCRVRYGNFISLSTFVHGICGEDFPRILGHCRC